MHNMMLFKQHADGRLLTDEEVAGFYLRAYEIWQAQGIEISAEVHVNMWSEDFRRIAPVARAVQSRGIPSIYPRLQPYHIQDWQCRGASCFRHPR